MAWPATGQMTFGIPTKTISNVCAFLLLRQKGKLNLLSLYQSDYEQRFQTKIDRWAKKTKACFSCLNLDHRKGDKLIYPVATSGEGSLLTNIFCRNCTGKNETVVWKILEVRESFESSRVHWSQERRDKVREKYMYWRRNSQQQLTSAVQMTMTFIDGEAV